MLYVALPTHYHEVGVSSLLEVGALLSVNRLVRLPLNPVIGYLYRTVSPRQGILLAVVLAGVTTSLCGVAKGFWFWVIIRSIWGLAWSFLKIGAFLLVLNLSDDKNRGSLMGKYNGLYRLGSLVGMLVGGFFADQIGIPTISLVFGIAPFLAIPAVIRYIPKTHGTIHQKQHVPSLETKHWWFDSRVLWILGSGLLSSMALDGLLTATLSHVIVTRHPAVVKWSLLTVGASTLAGTMQAARWSVGPWISPWIGKLSDRSWGRTRILALTFGVATLLMGMIPVRTPFVMWLVLIFILLLVSSLVTTLSDSVASDTALGSSAMAVMTTYTMALDVGAAVGPALGYGLEALLGTFSMYWGSTVVLACLTMKWAWTACSNRRQGEIRPLSM